MSGTPGSSSSFSKADIFHAIESLAVFFTGGLFLWHGQMDVGLALLGAGGAGMGFTIVHS